MWVNFKSGDEGKGRRMSSVPAVSRNHSKSSKKSVSSTSNLQKKVDEFIFETNTEEWEKDKKYKERRRKRKMMKKQLKQLKLKQAKPLFILASLLIFVGIILIFGASIRSISDGTFMWTNRKVLQVVGPAMLGAGVVVLMIAIAVDGHIKSKLNINETVKLKPLIHPDFSLDKQTISRNYSDVTFNALEDSFQPLIKQGGPRRSSRWYECTHFESTIKSDDSFWSSSGNSNLTSQDSHQDSHQWKHGLSICNGCAVTIGPLRSKSPSSNKCFVHNNLDSRECANQLHPSIADSNVLLSDFAMHVEGSVTNDESSDSIEKQYLERCVTEAGSVV